MLKIKLTERADSEILVVGLGLAGKKLQIESTGAQIDTATLLTTLTTMGATGEIDEVIKLPSKSNKLIVFTGLGKIESNFSPELLRRAAGAASRNLLGNEGASFALPHKSVAEIAAIAEGAALGSYSFTEFRGSTKSGQKSPLSSITIVTRFADTAQAKSAIKRAEIIAEQTFLVRDLVNTPPSSLTPDSFCLRAKKLASKYGVKVEVLNEAALRKGGYGGIIGVGQGSINPPRLLHLSYSPAKAKKRFAFVGKGITFDTGGISLKRPYESMTAMKSDMAGAAAVLSATVAMAKIKPKVKVTALLMAAENALSATSARPSDVITQFGGTTVEVLNTDAEGRLVLADGLAYADLELDPDYLVDVATLTGAATLGLGRQYAAMYTRKIPLAKKLHELGNKVGEKVWHMPLLDDYSVALDSDIADFNHLADKFGFSAGSVTAALFLEKFVGERTWVHLDIAGTGRSETDAGENVKGGTGFGARLLIEWLASF